MRILILFLSSLLFFSCNKDETTETEEGAIPTNFEIFVESISTNSAVLKWTDASTPDGASVLYNVYLNNVVIAEDIEELELPLVNLSPDTPYGAKVIAKNEYGQSENTIDFTTREIEEGSIPGDFEVSIEQLVPTSALLKWTKAASDDGLPVLYSVYLDDILFAENLDLFEFALENLIPETDYKAKVVAKNYFGVNEKTVQFTTPFPSGIYLHKLAYSPFNSQLFEYDENYNLIKHITNVEEPNWSTSYDYQYVNNLVVREDRSGYGYEKGICDYTYDSNGLIKIKHRYGDDIRRTDIYEFNSDPTLYTREYTVENGNNGDTYTINFSNNATYVQGNLTRLETKNETTNEIRINLFEYENGNLIKITDADNNVWEIDYDDKISFKTFNSHFVGAQFSFGIYRYNYLENNLVDELKRIPFFYDFNNLNNVTEVRKNGALFMNIMYQYNVYDYPAQATFNDGGIYTFEYLAL